MTGIFEVLRQGNMTIEEYYIRFMQLVRFTVDPAMSEAFQVVKLGKNLN